MKVKDERFNEGYAPHQKRLHQLINDKLGIVENYQQVIKTIIVNFGIVMKSLEELNKEAGEINLQIRRLLLNGYSYDDGIAQQLIKINTVATLRAQLVAIEREIRLRTQDNT